MRKIVAFLLVIIFLLLLSNQFTIFSILQQNQEPVSISRVIDGDTVELSDGRTARLANINSPEKNTLHASEATEFLKQYENLSIKMNVLGTDRYGRILAQFYAPEYLNELLVSNGLASKFLVQDGEKRKFAQLERNAIESSKGMWQHSPHENCFSLTVNSKLESVYIKSSCSISLEGYSLKDESRKIYKFAPTSVQELRLHTFDGSDNSTDLFWNSNTNIWNDDRDSAYLFDPEGRIAGYYFYGYS